MSEKNDVLNFIEEFGLNVIFDNKQSQGYVEDNTNLSVNVFYRALGNSDTDEYLNILFYKDYGYYPSDGSMKAINKSLTYKAKALGMFSSIHNRVAKKGMMIYVNTGRGTVIKITAKKVYLVNKSPVKFEINSCIGKMVKPDLINGDINLLKSYIRVKNGDFKLIIVFMLNCFFTDTHYIILVLMGPAGSAKSFITKILKTIIDPSVITLRNQIMKVEDLVIAAIDSHLVDMNNCSRFNDIIQDTICTMLTGGTRTTRTKFKNKDQTTIHTHNPMLVNGIGDIFSRDDVLERAVTIELKKISETDVVPIGEKQLTENFNKDLPIIMGGLFNSLSRILAEFENIEIPAKLNRMADFHILGLVAEKALDWETGSFTSAYNANIAKIQTDVIDSSEVSQSIIKMGKLNDAEFVGTYILLKTKLNRFGNLGNIDPRTLSADMDRVSSALLNLHGIKITRLKRSSSGSRVKINFN